MFQSASRRPWPAALLSAVMLAGAVLVAVPLAGSLSGAVAVAADEDQPAEASAPPAEPTLEPTPYPAFDPSSVTVRVDLLSDEFDAPVYVADDGNPDGKARCLYVVEQAGVVRIWDLDEGYVLDRPFLDIGRLVSTEFPEQGLHSIAFHPDFARNGRFFAHFNDRSKNAVIAEFKGRPCRPGGKAASKPVKTLLKVSQDFGNNNAGWIGFGPKDGKLYIPLGDGGGPRPGDPNRNGQAQSTHLSKVLRIDVDDRRARRYAVPPDNPYVRIVKGKVRARGDWAPETWATGLRDPRRASFDRRTGDFWIGDVGQDIPGEIDLVPAGSVKRGKPAPNFGWSHVEGESVCHPVNAPDCDPSQYTPPVLTVDEMPPHRAITGGYVYRGKAIPELAGVYLFSDFISGYVWGLDAGATYEGVEVPAHVLLEGPQGFVSFGEDDDGELYLVSLEGSVYRLGAEER
jgi:glucose/arabinose dehydrogenase